MQVVYPDCGGLDVHKKRVSACRMWIDENGHTRVDEASFGTYTEDLQRLGAWLIERNVYDVAMEATGPYWRPVWNVLETFHLRLTLANPGHIRTIPGHKTDRRDARWIADLHRHGLVPASFVPDAAQRRLRDLTRMRTKLVHDHVRVVNRVQAVLEDANIKLGSVVSDVNGASAQAMIGGLIGGGQPEQLTELARGSLRGKKAELRLALHGYFTAHHGFQLHRLRIQERALQQQQRALERQISKQLDDRQKQLIALWDTIPGVNQTVATIMVAELGTCPEQFPDAHHAASWVALCPGNHESAGKQKSGKTRKGDKWLRTALVEAAWAAARSKGTYLSALYWRLRSRKGEKRALVAVAHSMLVSAYQMAKTGEAYRDLGPNHFDRLRPQHAAKHLLKRLQLLGYRVELSPLQEAQPAATQ